MNCGRFCSSALFVVLNFLTSHISSTITHLSPSFFSLCRSTHLLLGIKGCHHVAL